MKKVYICTDEMIMEKLVYLCEEADIDKKVEEIEDRLMENKRVIAVEGTYVMGSLTAFLLEQKHGITCLEQELI